MTTYTKTQLKDAFCTLKGFDAEGEQTKADFFAKQEARADIIAARNLTRAQTQLDSLPKTGKESMKKEALMYLSTLASQQSTEDNAGVSL